MKGLITLPVQPKRRQERSFYFTTEAVKRMPLMWWKQHQEEFPRLARMARQYLAVPASSASPERLFSSVGFVKSDLRGSLLDTTLIDVCGLNKHPKINLKESKRKSTITQTYTQYTGTRQYICNWHTPIFVTGTH